MDRQGILTAKDLLNYEYCKRIVYFENVMRIPQDTTIKEYRGRKAHEEFTKKSPRTKIVKDFPMLKRKYNLALSSENLNFRTVLDCLLIDEPKNEAFPVQVKSGVKPQILYRSQKSQVLVEALLVKENLGFAVPKGFIKFLGSNDLVELPVQDEGLVQVKESIKGISHALETEEMPEPTEYVKRCKDCCYWNVCRRA